MNTLQSIVHPVRDLDAAKAIQTALLGVEPHTDQPYYVGFNVGGVEIALDPHGHDKGLTTPVAYFAVADLEAAVAEVLKAGATLAAEPQDVGGGTRIARVTDADGNTLGLIQAS
ncbi:MAG: VOC family protein [Acidimicrobiales bacterium]|jgi:predicted enzyme related to lactoylglutathione lyase